MSTVATARKGEQSYLAIPDSAMDPVGYLLAKGWKPDGDPRKPGCGWLDPQKPKQERKEERVILEVELPDGSKEQRKGLFVTPAAFPVSLHEAVSLQVDRDDASAKK